MSAARYDIAVIGTSPIAILEAVFQARSGRTVVMVDRAEEIGGAWRVLDVFGVHDVENAIHYFLPDAHAFQFMRNHLGWNVMESPRKYRFVELPTGRFARLLYDSPVARVAAPVVEGLRKGRVLDGVARAWRTWRSLNGRREPSRYVRGGAAEILGSVLRELEGSGVEVRLGTTVNAATFAPAAGVVRIETDRGALLAGRLVISHGTDLPVMSGPSGPFVPDPPMVERRPAAHLLIAYAGNSEVHECIFTADPIIKYVHDVTRYVREFSDLAGQKKKVLVLALHPDVLESDAVFGAIMDTLRRAQIVPRSAVLEDRRWCEVYLPPLSDAHFEALERAFGNQLHCLRTENFSRGIGYNSARWATRFRVAEQPG